jgi:hypothetical protein
VGEEEFKAGCFSYGLQFRTILSVGRLVMSRRISQQAGEEFEKECQGCPKVYGDHFPR